MIIMKSKKLKAYYNNVIGFFIPLLEKDDGFKRVNKSVSLNYRFCQRSQ